MIVITGYTHLATGALVGAALYHFHVDTSIVLGTIAGSLLPDIDHPGSKIGRRVPIISHIMYLFGHRGITHSLLFVLFLGMVGYFYWTPAYGLAIGSLVHVVGDMLTPSGVPLLWPHGRRYHLLGFRTGSIFDYLLGVSASLGAILIFMYR